MHLYKALAASPKAKAEWRGLTPTERRDFVGWIDKAKEPGIRMERIEQTRMMLIVGKRRGALSPRELPEKEDMT
jgi:uncharacterized protein YdeI (YjbR/CyaY-like superfamily)